MTEFKISIGLLSEVLNVKAKANLLNDGYTDVSIENLETLSTAKSYVAQHKEIKELLELYKALVVKDVADIQEMIKETEMMDSEIMNAIKDMFTLGGK